MTLTERMQDDFWREVDRLLFDHCSPWEIDEAMTACGFGIGACEMQDLLGLDTVLRRRGANDPSGILSRMVAEGRIGKQAGWGYDRYPGGGGAVRHATVDSARWVDTSWRLVIVTWAYVWVIAGMWFTISPWRLRDLIDWNTANQQRTRIFCGIRFAFGLFVILLGLTAFRQ